MKSRILTGAMVFALATLAAGAVCFADQLFWVVGNNATGKCEIVTSNPVVIGNVWFTDGPYRSMADAKLARSTISVCPKEDPSDK